MRERPILFSAPMVRALLAGTKTQTRRVVKPQPDSISPDGIPARFFHQRAIGSGYPVQIRCPYGQPGDRLWVREAWRADVQFDALPPRELNSRFTAVQFEAGGSALSLATPGKSRRAFHMPRWASRINLEVTSVRVERLQDISETDAVAEGIRISSQARRSDACYGIYECEMPDGKTHFSDSAYDLYRKLWEQINGDGSWAANPWVWVVEFRRIQP